MPRTNVQLAKRQEKRAAKELGGKRVQGSGNYKGLPGDVSSSDYLEECKFTSKSEIRIQLSWLNKIEIDALNRGKIPLLRFGFREKDRVVDEWIAVPGWHMEHEAGFLCIGGEMSCRVTKHDLTQPRLQFELWGSGRATRWTAIPANSFNNLTKES